GQSHFVLIPETLSPMAGAARPVREPGTSGLEVRTIGDGVVAWRVAPRGPAARAGIRPGDRVLAVGELVVDSAARALLASARDSVTAHRLLAAAVMVQLQGGVGDTVAVRVQPARGRPRVRMLRHGPIEGQVTRYGNLPPMAVHAEATPVRLGHGRTATLLRFNGWFPVLGPRLDSLLFAHRDAAGLVIDLRGNGGGVVGMIAGFSGHFLDTVTSLGELRSRGSTIRFSSNPRTVRPSGARVPVYQGPIAILVDEFTASTSEFFASGMQALGRARVFGSRSSGQALPAAMGRLPSGDVLLHVIADHEDAKGRRVEGVGITPDEPVALTYRDLQAGRDAPFDAARRWLARGAP
ncbi:MAG: hypothetical protein K1X31_04800, partial [Gemmatimonadaceae bacterium]|nr:hypothetical protein [Gemmatimonadaceae bacterium]